MRSRIYETVERLSVRTSVCLSYRSTAETADLLLSAREELLIDSGRHQQQRHITESSKCGQCHDDVDN